MRRRWLLAPFVLALGAVGWQAGGAMNELPRRGLAVVAPRGPREHWVGQSFARYKLVQRDRRDAIYGTCVVTSHEGCSPPLDVQTASICVRNPIALDLLPRSITVTRGVPVLNYGYGLDVLTGSTTVTLFAHLALARRAVKGLRPYPAARPARRLTSPRLPRWVVRQLALVVRVHARLGTGPAARRRLGISHSAILFQVAFARLLGARAIDGVRPATRSPGQVIADKQAYFMRIHGDQLTPAEKTQADRYAALVRAC